MLRVEADLPTAAEDWPEGTPERAVAERRDERARRAKPQRSRETGPVKEPSPTPPPNLFDGGEEALGACAKRPKPAQAGQAEEKADAVAGGGRRDEEDELLERHAVELARTAEALRRRADYGPIRLDGHGPDALRRAHFFVNEAATAVRRAREVLQEDAPGR